MSSWPPERVDAIARRREPPRSQVTVDEDLERHLGVLAPDGDRHRRAGAGSLEDIDAAEVDGGRDLRRATPVPCHRTRPSRGRRPPRPGARDAAHPPPAGVGRSGARAAVIPRAPAAGRPASRRGAPSLPRGRYPPTRRRAPGSPRARPTVAGGRRATPARSCGARRRRRARAVGARRAGPRGRDGARRSVASSSRGAVQCASPPAARPPRLSSIERAASRGRPPGSMRRQPPATRPPPPWLRSRALPTRRGRERRRRREEREGIMLRRKWPRRPLMLAAAMTGIVTTLVTVTGPVPVGGAAGDERGDRVERDRVHRDHDDRGTAAARGGDQHGDGAGRRLRRGERDRRRLPAYLVKPAANPGDSKEAAAATAAFRVLVGFPSGPRRSSAWCRRQRPALQTLYDASLANVPDGASETGGIAVGEAAAAAMLADRLGDGRGGPFAFVPGTDRGDWRLGPPQGTGGDRRRAIRLRGSGSCGRSSCRTWTCCVRTVRTTSPARPTQRTSRQVKRLGSLDEHRSAPPIRRRLPSSGRTTGRRSGTASSAPWRLVASLDIVDSARFFAMTGLAAADGSIGCWNDKAHWSFWRPITAIREAADDGNPATMADPDWVPLFDPSVPVSGAPLVTPGFPDHPSGHTCVSGAIVSRRCRASSAPTRSRSRRPATSACPRRVRRGASVVSRTRSRRSSALGCGAGSTSAPRIGKGPCSARRSRGTWKGTTSSPRTTRRMDGRLVSDPHRPQQGKRWARVPREPTASLVHRWIGSNVETSVRWRWGPDTR